MPEKFEWNIHPRIVNEIKEKQEAADAPRPEPYDKGFEWHVDAPMVHDEDGLIYRQRLFAAAFQGNISEAARQVGYKSMQAAVDAFHSPAVQKAIITRQDKRMNELIAKREERQEFWTNIMRDENMPIKDRLRASELLGKSEGDFFDRVENTVNISVASVLDEVEKRRKLSAGTEHKQLNASEQVIDVEPANTTDDTGGRFQEKEGPQPDGGPVAE